MSGLHTSGVGPAVDFQLMQRERGIHTEILPADENDESAAHRRDERLQWLNMQMLLPKAWK